MMIGSLNIAIAQINPIVGNVSYNLNLVRGALAQCDDADIIVFPELVLCGYPPEDLILKTSFVQMCMNAAQDFITSTKTNAAYILTTPWMVDGKKYTAALFVHG